MHRLTHCLARNLFQIAKFQGAASIANFSKIEQEKEKGVYTPETLQRIARLSDGLSRVEGVVADSVISISTVPRIALVDGTVDTDPLLRRQAN